MKFEWFGDKDMKIVRLMQIILSFEKYNLKHGRAMIVFQKKKRVILQFFIVI